jgi:hypothetical protein
MRCIGETSVLQCGSLNEQPAIGIVWLAGSPASGPLRTRCPACASPSCESVEHSTGERIMGETVHVTELTKNFEMHQKRSLRAPVTVSRRGRPSVVILAADEYKRLRSLDRPHSLSLH